MNVMRIFMYAYWCSARFHVWDDVRFV